MTKARDKARPDTPPTPTFVAIDAARRYLDGDATDFSHVRLNLAETGPVFGPIYEAGIVSAGAAPRLMARSGPPVGGATSACSAAVKAGPK